MCYTLKKRVSHDKEALSRTDEEMITRLVSGARKVSISLYADFRKGHDKRMEHYGIHGNVVDIENFDDLAAINDVAAECGGQIGFSNLVELVPNIRTPTVDINMTLALAVLSCAATHDIGSAGQVMRKYFGTDYSLIAGSTRCIRGTAPDTCYAAATDTTTRQTFGPPPATAAPRPVPLGIIM